MLDVRLMNAFEAVSLDQLDDPAKSGLHIGRQRFEFISNAIIEQLYNPRHPVILLHFCNIESRPAVPDQQALCICVIPGVRCGTS